MFSGLENNFCYSRNWPSYCLFLKIDVPLLNISTHMKAVKIPNNSIGTSSNVVFYANARLFRAKIYSRNANLLVLLYVHIENNGPH